MSKVLIHILTLLMEAFYSFKLNILLEIFFQRFYKMKCYFISGTYTFRHFENLMVNIIILLIYIYKQIHSLNSIQFSMGKGANGGGGWVYAPWTSKSVNRGSFQGFNMHY